MWWHVERYEEHVTIQFKVNMCQPRAIHLVSNSEMSLHVCSLRQLTQKRLVCMMVQCITMVHMSRGVVSALRNKIQGMQNFWRDEVSPFTKVRIHNSFPLGIFLDFI